MMLKKLKRIVGILSEEERYRRRQKAMEEFLGQATDRLHLEQLEEQWFKKHGWM